MPPILRCVLDPDVRLPDVALLSAPTALHEDTERLERIVVKDLKQETKSHRDKLLQSHRVRKRLGQIQEASRKLVRFLLVRFLSVCRVS